MLNTSHRLSDNARHLDLGGGGGLGGGFDKLKGRGMEIMLASALALIIIGSLVLTIWHSGSGGRSGTGDHKMMFHCEKCGKNFEFKPKKGEHEFMLESEMGISKIDCPECGGEKCAVPMVRCPKCKEYYVSKRTEYEARRMRGEQPEEGEEEPKDICPHCKTDRIQWYRDRRKKRKANK